MIAIGTQKINTNIFLAPLAGCADLSFRLIAREHGAKFCFYEMVDANSLIHGPGKNKDILMTHPADRPIAAQILGGDPDDTLKAAKILLDRIKPVFLDLNAACPARKVIKKRSGAYLVKDPDLLCAILSKLTSGLSLPITVKLRSGFYKNDHQQLINIAGRCEKSGAAALFIHGRPQKQLYRGVVDYAAIKAVKQSVKIPVIGSGDVLSPELAQKMFEETGCDGILVARGAMGSPWIFEQIENYLKTGKIQPEVSFEQKKKILLRHLSYMEKYRQSRPTNKIGLMRKIALLYLKHLPNAAKIRTSITSVKSYQQLIEVIEKL